MHNTHTQERVAVTAGLACLCSVGVVTAVAPVAGYILLGLLALGVAALVATGLTLWWGTRYRAEQDRVDQGAHILARSVRREVA